MYKIRLLNSVQQLDAEFFKKITKNPFFRGTDF